MRWFYKVHLRFRSLTRRSRVERDLADELHFHLEELVEENTARGMTPEEARYAALRELGGVEQIKEECRNMRQVNYIENLIQDIRFGLRMLAKNPGFTAVAVATLALGIGANTAIFQLVDAVRLRTLPVENPQQIVRVQLADLTGRRGSQASWYTFALTNPVWEQIRGHRQLFSDVFAWANFDFNLAPAGEKRLARGLWVSGNLFRVVGVRPILGRVFAAADDHRGCGLPGAVISYAFWQRDFGGDRSVVGRKLTIDHHPVEIIGITPARFFGLEIGRSFDVALPICSQATLGGEFNWLDAGTVWWLTVMGRLKSGESLAGATAQLQAISPGVFEATLPKDYPPVNVKDYLKFKLTAVAGGTGVSSLRDEYGNPLWLLLATAGLVLLIACANLANLMLARATAREREIAVRLAVGASRGRLVSQLLVESFLLGMLGGGTGLLLARMLSQLLVSLLNTQGNPLFLNLNLDWRVLAFTSGLIVLTCVFFGLAPALRATRLAPGAVMKAESRGLTENRERFTLRRALVVTQLALSLVLLVGALLFSLTLNNLLTLDPGFREDGILAADIDLTQLNLPVNRRLTFKRELLRRLRAVPGVDSAAEAGLIPLSGGSTDNVVWPEGSDRTHGIEANFNWISQDYFKTLEIPLLAGRDFDDRDTPTSPRVAIVNEAFARQLGVGPSPEGRSFRIEATPTQPETVFEITALVKDTKYLNLREASLPIAFLSTFQDSKPDPFDQILIRSTAPAADITTRLRRSIAEIDPQISTDFWIFKTMIGEKLLRERLMATISGFFGFLAVLLATIGLYGVTSYTVVRRTNEIGIRMALGAGGHDVLAMIMGEATVLLVTGLAVGTLLALGAARIAGSMLFGLRPDDPVAFTAAVATLAAVVLVASYVPARRATKVDPMVALRYE
jgi:predicted permease